MMRIHEKKAAVTAALVLVVKKCLRSSVPGFGLVSCQPVCTGYQFSTKKGI
jgi:hypothetical protein